MEACTWKVGSSYAKALSITLRRRGLLEAVTAAVPEAAREFLQAPEASPWRSGVVMIAALEALEVVGGPGTVRSVGIELSHAEMGPMIRPLANLALMLTKDPKSALLTRIQSFVSAALDKVAARHEPGQRPVVIFTFPEPVPVLVGECWYGTLEVGFSLLKCGRIVSVELTPTVHRFELAWDQLMS